MKHSARWLLLSLLSLPALAAWLHTALPRASGSPSPDSAAQATQRPIEVSTPTRNDTPVLGEHPTPQVDASAPPEDQPPTF